MSLVVIEFAGRFREGPWRVSNWNTHELCFLNFRGCNVFGCDNSFHVGQQFAMGPVSIRLDEYALICLCGMNKGRCLSSHVCFYSLLLSMGI